MVDDGARVEPGEEERVRAALEQLQGLLVPGETLQAYAVERRLFALTHRRTLVAATTGRLIAVSRHLISGFRIQDVRWQDLKDARLEVGILGADLFVSSVGGADLAIAGENAKSLTFRGLRKAQAQSVYRACQAQEQAWREKRRIRELEELRAKSGGIHLGGAAGGGFGAVAEGDDPVERLKRAKEMLQSGLITDAEYESIKAKIVSNL